MKKLLTTLTFSLILLSTFAHTLTKQCWLNNRYNIQATFGDANGKIEVTTYTNSTRTVLVEATQTYFLNSSGAVLFSVLQPQQNTNVFVYVRWFYKQGGSYFPTTWNSGQGYPNSYSSVVTGINVCNTVANTNYNIIATKIGNELTITLQTKNYTKAYVEYSRNNKTYKRYEISSDKILFILDEGTTYIRIKYIVGSSVIYSNTLVANHTDYSIDYQKPYQLYIYNQEGKLTKIINNNQHLQLLLSSGVYYLKYWQIKNNIEIIKIVKFIKA